MVKAKEDTFISTTGYLMNEVGGQDQPWRWRSSSIRGEQGEILALFVER
jgi:hypothetical protein